MAIASQRTVHSCTPHTDYVHNQGQHAMWHMEAKNNQDHVRTRGGGRVGRGTGPRHGALLGSPPGGADPLTECGA
eukprot:14593364-Alexandrium_andersonii.AAC.2